MCNMTQSETDLRVQTGLEPLRVEIYNLKRDIDEYHHDCHDAMKRHYHVPDDFDGTTPEEELHVNSFLSRFLERYEQDKAKILTEIEILRSHLESKLVLHNLNLVAHSSIRDEIPALSSEPPTIVTTGTGFAGISNSVSRSDHQHAGW